MHSRWLKTRRHFYESLRQEIQLFTGLLTDDIQVYQDEYEKIFENVWDISSMDILLKKISESKIVIGGDYHYFYQSQRTHFGILRKLLAGIRSQNRKIYLHLEIFNSRDQKKVDDFLSSKITFEELIKKTKWQKLWGNLPLEGYAKILKWAKDNKVQVYGINNTKLDDLYDRDVFSASMVDQYFEADSTALHYVIYGDFHLAKNHLPAKIKHFNPQHDLVLHLNSDKLYFTLSEHAIEDQFDVLNYGHEFCVLSSTPWVKLQSYLVFLQEMDDQMISEVDDDDLFEPDFTDYLGKILDTYTEDFQLPNWKNLLDVLIPKDLDFEKLDFLKLKKQEKEKLTYFVTAQKNVVFPKDQIQFLAKPSVNGAYGLIGEFIHAQLSQRQSLNWMEEYFMPRRIWLEAVSFFFALWLNPTITVMSESDLNARLNSLDQKGDFDNLPGKKEGDYAEAVLRFSVDYRLTELQFLKNKQDESLITSFATITEAPWNVQLESAAILGKIVGQKLYKRFKSGLLSRDTLVDYLSVPLESENFIIMYGHLLSELD